MAKRGVKKDVKRLKLKSLNKEEVLEIVKNLKKALRPNGGARTRIYLAKDKKEFMLLWEKLTKNFKKETIETNEKGIRVTRVLDDGTEIHLRSYSSRKSGNTPTIDTKINGKDYKIHIEKGQ